MFTCRSFAPGAIALVALAMPALATAQPNPSQTAPQTDPMRMAYLANANQLGVMEYCQSQGWADQAAVDAQKAAAASLPPPADPTGLDEAEATGRKGELLANGSAMPIASMAQQSHTTEQALCGQLAASAKMGAAQRSAMPSFPAMPAMPGGTAVPAMSPGMTMPNMPGMPKTQ